MVFLHARACSSQPTLSYHVNDVLCKCLIHVICGQTVVIYRKWLFLKRNFFDLLIYDFPKLVMCKLSRSFLVPYKYAVHFQIRELYCMCLEKNIWDSEEYASVLQLLR